jgi:hypothetical protein
MASGRKAVSESAPVALHRAMHRWILTLGAAVAPLACTDPGQPVIAGASSQELSATPSDGIGSATRTITIANAGTGDLKDLAISFPAGTPTWLNATLDASTAPTTLTLVATAGSLPLGRYTALLEISAKGAAPVTITIGFTVQPSATTYWISPQNLRLIPGEVRRMEVWRINASAKQYSLADSTRWSSSDAKVATVSGIGVVTAVDAGVATITSPYGSTTVTVRAYAGLQFKQVVAAGGRICALTTEGAVYCWGQVGAWGLSPNDGVGGTELDLGSPAFEKTEIPMLAVGGPGGHLSSYRTQYVASPELIATPAFASIGASERETCGVTIAGQVHCWGVSYILGGGTFAASQQAALPFTAASAAPPCVLTTAAAVWCYASTSVPFGSYAARAAGVRQFATPAAWQSLGGTDAVARATCGIASDGKGYCWGFQCLGNLGVGADGTAAGSCRAAPDPLLVSSSLTFSALVNSCGLAAGALYCTGPTPDTARSPGLSTMTQITGLPDFSSLSSGTGRCALTPAGETYCWGSGVLALGASTLATAPTPVRSEPGVALASVTSGASGYGVSCGIGTDQLLYCWGNRFVGDGLPPGIVGGFSTPTKVRVVRIGGPAPGIVVVR